MDTEKVLLNANDCAIICPLQMTRRMWDGSLGKQKPLRGSTTREDLAGEVAISY